MKIGHHIKTCADYLIRERVVTMMLIIIILFFANPMQLIEGDTPTKKSYGDSYSTESRLETTHKLQSVGKEMLEDFSKSFKGKMVSLLIVMLFLSSICVYMLVFFFFKEAFFKWIKIQSIDKVPWGLGDAFKIFVMLIFLDIAFSTMIAVFLTLIQKGTVNANVVLMGTTLIRSSMLFFCIWHLVKSQYASPIRYLGWTTKRISHQVASGVLSYMMVLPLYIVVVLLLTLILKWLQYEPPVQAPIQLLLTESNKHILFIFGIFVGILGPLFEEILFRGFLYQCLKKYTGALKAMLITSAIFALLHAHLAAILPIFFLGLAINYVYEKTGSIIPGAVLHMTHNSLMLFIAMQVKGLLV